MITGFALSPSLDLTYDVEALRHGDIARPWRVTRVAGGKTLNAVRVAAACGARVQAVAALGGHTGAWIADLLAQDGVSTVVVPLTEPTRMCSAVVERDGGTASTDLYEPATALTASQWEAFAEAAVAATDQGGWVVLSGSLPAGVEAGRVADLLDRVRSLGARVAVDSSGVGLAELAPHADLVKVNTSEASELLGGAPRSAEVAARAIRERLGADVVITDGVRGAFAWLGDDQVTVAPPTRLGRYSAGSGDAFLGGLVAGLDRGLAPRASLDLGRDAAERNALAPGQGVLAGLD